jgi:hypothetical protein
MQEWKPMQKCWMRKEAAKFAHHRNDSNWETLKQRRNISRIYALFKAYMGERAWRAMAERLERPCYLSRVDHDNKIRSRKQYTDIGKYSFVNKCLDSLENSKIWFLIRHSAYGFMPSSTL